MFFEAVGGQSFAAVGHIVWHKGYASRRGFLNARHEQAYVLVKGHPRKPAQPLDDVQPWEYSGNVMLLKEPVGINLSCTCIALSGRRYFGIDEAEGVRIPNSRGAG